MFAGRHGRRINMGSFARPDFMDCKPCTADIEHLLLQSAEAIAWWHGLPRRRLAKGEALLRAGDRPAHVWRIEQGLVRLYFLASDGTERNRSFQAEGQWIGAGMPLAADPGPSPFGIAALEVSIVVCVPLGDLRHLCSVDPRADALLQDMAAWTFQRQSRREAELLLLDAAQRYQSFLEEFRALANRIPLHQVASYIGITNVALSRLRRRRTGGVNPQPRP